jgi:hypothetical protein
MFDLTTLTILSISSMGERGEDCEFQYFYLARRLAARCASSLALEDIQADPRPKGSRSYARPLPQERRPDPPPPRAVADSPKPNRFDFLVEKVSAVESTRPRIPFEYRVANLKTIARVAKPFAQPVCVVRLTAEDAASQ